MTSYAWCLFRYTYSQHVTWLVNSAAHKWGNRPYDVTINPSENVVVSLLTGGKRNCRMLLSISNVSRDGITLTKIEQYVYLNYRLINAAFLNRRRVSQLPSHISI